MHLDASTGSQNPDTLQDLVTVIIPTYNRAHLVVQAIETVRRQTWKNVQIIVVDDGSTDDTQTRVSCMPDVHYIRQERKGQAAARNSGLRHARGEFICTLDSDDLWYSHFLEESISALQNLDVDFVFSNWFRQNGDGSIIRSYFETVFSWWNLQSASRPGWRTIDPELMRDTIQFFCVAPSSAFVFPRELIGKGWQESVKVSDDWALLQDMVISKPCRVGVFMRRSWVKRVNTDNVCDSDEVKTRKALLIDAPRRLLEANSKLLSGEERSRLYRRMASEILEMTKLEPLTSANLAPNMRELIAALTLGFISAPGVFLRKLFVRDTWTPPAVAPPQVLASEGLLNDPQWELSEFSSWETRKPLSSEDFLKVE